MSFIEPPFWPVPSVPPKPPQITLLGSSVAPPSSDDLNGDPTPEAVAELAKQRGMLPADLLAELDTNDNERWIRGFGYLPDNHSAATTRSPQDTTTVDSALTPANLAKVLVVPFAISTKFSMSSLAWDGEDFRERAEIQNDAASPSAIEYEFWTGTLAKVNDWPNNYLAGTRSTDITPTASVAAYVLAQDAPSLPLTVVAASNDTFVFTSTHNDPNSPDTFTIAPGVYTSIAELAAAVNAALSSADGSPLSAYLNVTADATKLLFTEIVRGTRANGDTLTEGNAGLAAMGFTGTGTFAHGANATAVSVVEGIGLLQTAIARAGLGGQAMIHLTPEAAPNLLNSRRVGKFLLDQFDNIIVPGSGYPGTGPSTDPPATGTTWIYATDMVNTRIQKKCRVFPSTFAEALDRGQDGNPNLVTFRAERLASAYFDGFLQVAVLVDFAS